MLNARINAPVVSLDLVNDSAIASTEVPLFTFNGAAFGTGASATATSRTIAVTAANFGAGTWTLNYREYGVSASLISAAGIGGWEDLIEFWNANLTQNSQGIFWAIQGSPSTSADIYAAPTRYQLLSAVDAFGVTIMFSNSSTGYIGGTSARVTMNTPLTYNAVVSEFTQQPYLLTTMYVSANTYSQAQNEYKLNNINQSGLSLEIPQFPLLDAMPVQNVASENPVFLETNATSFLSYTLEPSGSVTLVVSYFHISQFDLAQLASSKKYVDLVEKIEASGDKMLIEHIHKMLGRFDTPVTKMQVQQEQEAKKPVLKFHPPLMQVVVDSVRKTA